MNGPCFPSQMANGSQSLCRPDNTIEYNRLNLAICIHEALLKFLSSRHKNLGKIIMTGIALRFCTPMHTLSYLRNPPPTPNIRNSPLSILPSLSLYTPTKSLPCTVPFQPLLTVLPLLHSFFTWTLSSLSPIARVHKTLHGVLLTQQVVFCSRGTFYIIVVEVLFSSFFPVCLVLGAKRTREVELLHIFVGCLGTKLMPSNNSLKLFHFLRQINDRIFPLSS